MFYVQTGHNCGMTPSGPFGYATCTGCGVAVQRRVLPDGHDCEPERYARHQALRFDEALGAWLATPAGAFARFYARRRLATDS